MSSGAGESDLRSLQQGLQDPDTAWKEGINAALKDLHTSLPGIVQSYDAGKQTVSVQPAIKRIFSEKGETPLPLCVDVPVCFPGGGDFYLTFPVKKGDDCILVFSERCIDAWYSNGGVQPPAEYRTHDFSDAFAIVGVNSQPRKLSNVQTDGAELRSRSRSTYIKITDGGIEIKGDITHDGSITSTGDHTAAGISLDSHAHTGVKAGSDNTGGPQ